MKPPLRCPTACALAVLVPAIASAEVFILPFTVDAIVPDGESSGRVDVRTVAVPATRILDVDVTLTLRGTGDGGFNGDLYAYLTHDSGTSILLNRPGRREEDAYGYADSGMGTLTFDDEGTNGDIHGYRLGVTGDHAVPLPEGATLSTGTWWPDARQEDPERVLDTTRRTAPLALFNDLNPNGVWTLFVADLSTGGTVRFDEWTLRITAVPEPSELTLVVGLVLAGYLGARRWWGT